MNIPPDMPRLKGFRYPRKVIACAVWTYHRFALSRADVEDLLAERAVIVSREAIRLWVNRFGQHFADCIRRDRPRSNDKWHMDEVVITIRGTKHWLWRAIDATGDVPGILVQTGRNTKAATRFFRCLIAASGEPRVVITDKLRSTIKPVKLASRDDHRARKGLNNAIEVSHSPTRKREKMFGRFKYTGKPGGFCLRMTGSTSSSLPAAINSPQIHIAMHVPMLSACGKNTRPKWQRERGA